MACERPNNYYMNILHPGVQQIKNLVGLEVKTILRIRIFRTASRSRWSGVAQELTS